jgi:hypothetical protein
MSGATFSPAGSEVHVTLKIELSEELQNYLTTCARIRGISHQRLLLRLIKAACEDQMIGSILDDDARRIRQATGENIRSHFKKLKKTAS